MKPTYKYFLFIKYYFNIIELLFAFVCNKSTSFKKLSFKEQGKAVTTNLSFFFEVLPDSIPNAMI